MDEVLRRAGSTWPGLLRHVLLAAAMLGLVVASAIALEVFAPSFNEALMPAGAGVGTVLMVGSAAIRRWRCDKR